MGYFQSIKSPENERFVKDIKAKYGADRVVGDPMECGYNSVYLWKLAVEKAKSFDVDKVIAASGGIEVPAHRGQGPNSPDQSPRRQEGARRSRSRRWAVRHRLRVGRHRAEPVPEALIALRERGTAAVVPLGTPTTGLRMSFDILMMQLFNGLSLFSILLLMAIGLAIVFGLMGVINMAHGELMALGAYATYFTARVIKQHLPALLPVYLFVAIVVAFGVTFAFGYLLERGFIRFFYNRPLDTLLATWGLSLILQQSYRSIFGAQEVSVPLTSWLSGAWEPTAGIQLPLNRIFILGLTLSVALGVYLILFKTRAGLRARAVTQTRDELGGRHQHEPRRRADLRAGFGAGGHCRRGVHDDRLHQSGIRTALHHRLVHRRRLRRCREPFWVPLPRRSRLHSRNRRSNT